MQGILLILGENGLQMQSCEKHRNQKDCFLCRQETKETDKSILVICQELFKEDFDVFFRKKGNFNRPSVCI